MNKTFIPYGRQTLNQDDINSVLDVLTSDFLTCGPVVDSFECALADYCGTDHAVAVSNGTAALHLAMIAAEVGPGDCVLTSANTFLASANCAEFVGARAGFADVDPDTLCLSVDTLREAWNPDVKAVVAVDFAGFPCATKEMADFVHERGAVLIEDACHSIGGQLNGHQVGGFPWVDMTTFSFHPVKTMTTGEGGAVLTQNGPWAEKIRLFRSHGMERGGEIVERLRQALDEDSSGESNCSTQTSYERSGAPWLYAMDQIGYNYRITDIQCALGLSQIKKLDGFVKRRTELVKKYDQAFSPISSIHRPSGFLHLSELTHQPAWHLYPVRIDFAALGKSRQEVMHELMGEKIGSQVHYIPVHLQPYYAEKYGYRPGAYPEAERYYKEALSLPLYPGLKDEEQAHVIETICRILG